MPRLLLLPDTTSTIKKDEFLSPLDLIKHQSHRFPEKLFLVLLDERSKKAIRWNQDGTRFSIINRRKLCNEVLPRYYDSKAGFKYTSFTRKLKRWNFKRSSSGFDKSIFSHPLFQRDKPILCLKMICERSTKKDDPQVATKNNPARSVLTNQCSWSDGEEIEPDPQLSSAFDEHVVDSPLLNQYEDKRMSRDIMITMLRHEASILYDYHKSPPMFRVCPDDSSFGSSSNVKTQAIIDAAVIAMKRCDITLLQRKKQNNLSFPCAPHSWERTAY